jgi:hypothetical protein
LRLLTTDIYEGAYLLSKGIELSNIWEDYSRKKKTVVFEFKGDDIGLLRKTYLRGQAKANVLRLKNSINELKDVMFNLLREKNLREKELRGEKENAFTGENFKGKEVYRHTAFGS